MLLVVPDLTVAGVRASMRDAAAAIARSADALPDGVPDGVPEEILQRADSLARDLADYARRAEVLAAVAVGAVHHDRPAGLCGDARDGGVVRRLGPAPRPASNAPTANLEE